MPNARARMNALVTKLGGKLLPAGFEEPKPQPAQPAAPTGPSEGVPAALEAEFTAMTVMDEGPQQRGYAFERFLKRWCDT